METCHCNRWSAFDWNENGSYLPTTRYPIACCVLSLITWRYLCVTSLVHFDTWANDAGCISLPTHLFLTVLLDASHLQGHRSTSLPCPLRLGRCGSHFVPPAGATPPLHPLPRRPGLPPGANPPEEPSTKALSCSVSAPPLAAECLPPATTLCRALLTPTALHSDLYCEK